MTPNAISLDDVVRDRDAIVLIDVRKRPARERSGLAAAGSIARAAFAAETWWSEFSGRRVVVHCAHGHEVSQALCGFLCDQGIDATYLDGGFEAWRAAGLPVEPIT